MSVVDQKMEEKRPQDSPFGKLKTPTPTIPFTKLKMDLDIDDFDSTDPPGDTFDTVCVCL